MESERVLHKELYQWCRHCLHNGRGLQGRDTDPEDPAEFLVTLFDEDSVPSECFENFKTKTFQCEGCKHEKIHCDTEKILMVSQLDCFSQKPVQEAIYEAFGYRIQIHNPVSPIPAYQQSSTRTRDVSASKDEMWWRCDDAIIELCSTVTKLIEPYLLFYAARDKRHEYDTSHDTMAPCVATVTPFDSVVIECEGPCKEAQPHNMYTSNYETNKVLVIHIVSPQKIEFDALERTILEDNQTPYDLTAVLCRVPIAQGYHYVTYRRQLSTKE